MMKKYYKVKLFISIAFCILTIVLIICIVFLLCYIIGFRIPIELDNATCENINMIVVSLTTGYIVSYITYVLSAHIPNYKHEIRNERLLRMSYLWRYKTDLTECFSLLVHLHRKNLPKISQIEEIKSFFLKSNYKWFYHEYLINEAKQSKGKSIISNYYCPLNHKKSSPTS